MWEKVKDSFILIIIAIIVLIINLYIGFTIGVNYEKNKYDNIVTPIDTTYNRVILDSIEYNILIKDSVIYKLNTEMKDEIDKSYELNDSSAVKLFYKLLSDD